jgi:putative ATPase
MNIPDKPLAERMRPQKLEDVAGQSHLIGEGKVLTRIIESGVLPSIIFWGPPGVGKTTIAQILAREKDQLFFQLSAISAGVKDVRHVIDQATKSGKAVLFIDEIHRFSKSQQDALLGAVEKGIITLIGATTENPSFEVISPLLSRCQVYTLNPLGVGELKSLLEKAIQQDKWTGQKEVELREMDILMQYAGGDARRVLNLFELLIGQSPSKKIIITNEMARHFIQQKMARYDKDGEQHYDIISAFIKSIRGSDPNAAIYWLARMVEGGEDPKFIARRLLILASEDIGNANPNALLLANACFEAVEKLGFPECRINLAQVTAYLAASPKSNAAYMAIKQAKKMVKKTGDLAVPLHLRNAPTGLMKDLGYAKDYKYAHNHEGNFVELEFMPDELSGKKLYEPGDNARENALREFLKKHWGKKYGY